MAVDQRHDAGEVTAAGASGLVATLHSSLPAALPVGRATAIFLNGICFHRREAIRKVEVLVDGARHRPAAWRMPRLDVFQSLHPELASGRAVAGSGDPSSRAYPEVRCYRSGFWATVPIQARDRPGRVELRLAAHLAGGEELVAPLGQIEVVAASGEHSYKGPAERPERGLIAVCMATFDPDMELFRKQVDSLRAQTDTNWLCVISDDCSRPERFDEIKRTVAGDLRFVVSRSERRLGYYRNFERALELIPAEAELVALCDQDDHWYPDKLQVLRAALGDAQLVYSDQRLVDRNGRVLRETLWEGRRNNHTNLASLLIANTVTGAATLFRREVVDLALPFPDTPGWQFHDHWLGLVAMATGDVAYVDRPLYDYVQHAGAIVGQVTREAQAQQGDARSWSRRLRRRSRELLRGWRAMYFYGYLAREVQAQTLLARCPPRLTSRGRRVLKRFIASDHSLLAFAWLAARPSRRLLGFSETLGTEAELVRGIMWRRMIVVRTGRRQAPNGSPYDATCPPHGVETFGSSRLARWRTLS